MENKVSKYQKFETKVITRSEIKNAEYNPRKISDSARKKLRENIKRVRLLDTIVVNKNTMNIVSGHQRVSILDSLERKQDYCLTVALVDLTEKEEIEQNLFFNNSKAQGEYDTFALGELFEYNDIEIENTGFDLPDLGILGVEVDLQPSVEEEPEDENDKELLRLNNKIFEDSHELRKAISSYSKEGNKENNDIFVVLTFSNDENKARFLEKYGFLSGDKYIKGEVLDKIISKSE